MPLVEAGGGAAAAGRRPYRPVGAGAAAKSPGSSLARQRYRASSRSNSSCGIVQSCFTMGSSR